MKEKPKQEIDMSKYIVGIDPYDKQEIGYSKKEVLAFGKFCIDKVADFLDGKGDQSDSQEHSIEELFEQFKK